MLQTRFIPGATYGEAWPDGSIGTTQTVPPGLGTDLMFTHYQGGRYVGKDHEGPQGGHALYWRGDKWIDLTPNADAAGSNPCAFHPTSGEVYVSQADGVHVYSRDGVLVRVLPGYAGSQGIRHVNADGSIQTGDKTYGDGVLSEYTDLPAFRVGMGHDGGGLAIEVGGKKHTFLRGAQTFCVANQVGDQIAVYAYDAAGGYLTIGSVADFLAVPADAVSTDPPVNNPPASNPPAPDPVSTPVEVPPVSAPVPFDWSSAKIAGGSVDVRSWPETAAITHVQCDPDGVSIAFTKANDWPDVVPPGWSGPIQFTLWLAECIGGAWYLLPAIEFWRNGKNGGNVSAMVGAKDQIEANWCYWAGDPMQSHPVPAGEPIGLFVTAGDRRRMSVGSVSERSNIVFLARPASVPAGFDFAGAAPVVQPADPPPPSPPAFDPSALEAEIAELKAREDALEAREAALEHAPAPDLSGVVKKGDVVSIPVKLPIVGNVTLKGKITE